MQNKNDPEAVKMKIPKLIYWTIQMRKDNMRKVS